MAFIQWNHTWNVQQVQEFENSNLSKNLEIHEEIKWQVYVCLLNPHSEISLPVR